jgi:hypothetical protein
MKRFRLIAILAALVLLALAVPSLAHEGRTVGQYAIELGWRVEPAYTGIFNGPELFVNEAASDPEATPEMSADGDEEEAVGAPVEGLEETLTLEVSFGGKSKILKLYPVWNDPGHYTADVIPTQPGDYSFHLSGKIGDLDIDETFTSADGKFGSVDPISDIQFP